MKREFLEALDLGAGAKLAKELVDKILDENSKDIGTHKNNVDQLTTERDGLKTQLETATKEIKSYKDLDVEGIKAKTAEWEAKYNTDTQALKDQLTETNYGFSVKDAVSSIKFTSEGAKKAFIADLTAKKLPVQEGKLLGMDDFVKTYQTSDPGAFAPAGDDQTLVITKGGGAGAAVSDDAALRAAFGLASEEKK